MGCVFELRAFGRLMPRAVSVGLAVGCLIGQHVGRWLDDAACLYAKFLSIHRKKLVPADKTFDESKEIWPMSQVPLENVRDSHKIPSKNVGVSHKAPGKNVGARGRGAGASQAFRFSGTSARALVGACEWLFQLAGIPQLSLIRYRFPVAGGLGRCAGRAAVARPYACARERFAKAYGCVKGCAVWE